MGRSEYANEMARRATFRVSEIKKVELENPWVFLESVQVPPNKKPTQRPVFCLEVPGGLEPPYSVLQTDT